MSSSPRELIEEFYEQVKEKYPDMNYAQIEAICRHPFTFVRKKMEQPNLPDIRLKYFGVFRVKPYRAKDRLKENDRMLALGRITPKKHGHFKTILSNFIERHESKSNNQ